LLSSAIFDIINIYKIFISKANSLFQQDSVRIYSELKLYLQEIEF